MKVSTYTGAERLNWGVWAILLLACSTWPLARADALAPNPTSLVFPAGGTIVMKINQGEVEVVGVDEDRISVSWQGRARDEERNVKVRLEQPSEKEATLVVDNWDDHVRIRIQVPRRSDVAIHMRAGELKVAGVVGSMDVDLIAGEMNLRLPEPGRYKAVSASVTAGQLTAKPWRTDATGLWRSFKANGQGDLELRARLIVGELAIGPE